MLIVCYENLDGLVIKMLGIENWVVVLLIVNNTAVPWPSRYRVSRRHWLYSVVRDVIYSTCFCPNRCSVPFLMVRLKLCL